MKSGKVFCLSGALFLALLLTGCAAPERAALLLLLGLACFPGAAKRYRQVLHRARLP